MGMQFNPATGLMEQTSAWTPSAAAPPPVMQGQGAAATPSSDAISGLATSQKAAAAPALSAQSSINTQAQNVNSPSNADATARLAEDNFLGSLQKGSSLWGSTGAQNTPEGMVTLPSNYTDWNGYKGGDTVYALPGTQAGGSSWDAGGSGYASLTAAQLQGAGGKYVGDISGGTPGWVFGQDPITTGGLGSPGSPGSQVKYAPGEDTDWTGPGLVLAALTAGIGGSAMGFGAGAEAGAGAGAADLAGAAPAYMGTGMSAASGGGLTAATDFGVTAGELGAGAGAAGDLAGQAPAYMGTGTSAASGGGLTPAADFGTAATASAGSAPAYAGTGTSPASGGGLTPAGGSGSTFGLPSSVTNGLTNALESSAIKSGVGAVANAVGGGGGTAGGAGGTNAAGLATGALGFGLGLTGYGQTQPTPINLPATNNAAMIAANEQGANGVMQTFHSMNDPIFALATSNMDTQLKNQGIQPGTTAYNNAMTQLSTQQNQLTAANEGQAAQLGLTSAKNTFGMQELGGEDQFKFGSANAGITGLNQAANASAGTGLLNSALTYGLTPQTAGGASLLGGATSGLYNSLFGSPTNTQVPDSNMPGGTDYSTVLSGLDY